MNNKMQPLGRGLRNLVTEQVEVPKAYIPELDINLIVPNAYQPRLKIDESKLRELADSIQENGVIEPLIVTKLENGKYELIAGERRWRAAKLAERETVPVVVREASPQQMLELAIVENVQRADLNPLEEALAFEQLVDSFNVTPSEIAKKVGFSASLVSNKIRLLQLPDQIKQGLIDEIISEGHAKTLLGIRNSETMLLAFNKVINQHLSVRATEELVRRLNLGVKKNLTSKEIILDSKSINYEQNLRKYFNTEKIKLTRSQKGGRIEMKFRSDEELDQLLMKIGIL